MLVCVFVCVCMCVCVCACVRVCVRACGHRDARCRMLGAKAQHILTPPTAAGGGAHRLPRPSVTRRPHPQLVVTVGVGRRRQGSDERLRAVSGGQSGGHGSVCGEDVGICERDGHEEVVCVWEGGGRWWAGSCRRDGGSEAQLGLYREAAAADFLAGRRLQDECPPPYTWRSVLLGWFR